MTPKPHKMRLTTRELWVLDHACEPLWDAFPGGTYLVGTAQTGTRAHRDVDVRTILKDDEFDRLFDGAPKLWQLLCLSICTWLVDQTGLAVDYQVQRMTEANQKHPGPRNPLGMGRREYAGLGDATPFKAAAT